MKLQIENNSFTLNVEKAVELGVLIPDRIFITDIKAGDKFKWPETGEISTIISISGYNEWIDIGTIQTMYVIAGIGGNQSAVYTQPLRTKSEMIKYLNDNNYVKLDK
jgi:hypothetical protein